MTPSNEAPPPRPAWRRYGLRAIGLALFVAVLLTVDLGQVREAVSEISAVALTEAAALCLVLVLLKCLRWYLLLTWLEVPQRVSESIGVYADSLFWGMITPGRLGELKRTLYLKRRRDVPLVRAGALWLVDQGFDLLAIAAILLATAAVEPAAIGAVVPAPALYAAAGTLAVLVLLRAPILRLIRLAVRRRPRLGYLVEGATGDLIALGHGRFLLLFAISVAALAAYGAMVVVLASALPFDLPLAHLVAAVALVMLAALLPISYMNLGSREMVLVLLFAVHGLTPEDAVAFSFVFVLCYLFVIPTSFVTARLAEHRLKAYAV